MSGRDGGPAMQVLVVDDEPMILRARKMAMGAIATLTLCSCLAEAKKALAAKHFDAVICDEELPDGSGLAFLDTLKRESPRTHRLLCCGSTPRQLARALREQIVEQFFQKPASPGALRKTLLELCSSTASEH